MCGSLCRACYLPWRINKKTELLTVLLSCLLLWLAHICQAPSKDGWLGPGSSLHDGHGVWCCYYRYRLIYCPVYISDTTKLLVLKACMHKQTTISPPILDGSQKYHLLSLAMANVKILIMACLHTSYFNIALSTALFIWWMGNDRICKWTNCWL